MSDSQTMRSIAQLVRPGSRVLDLGCGDGELLAHLRDNFAVTGYGLEIDEDKINACVARQVNVIQQNLNDGLSNFGDNSFDSVIMTQALQAVEKPDKLLRDMLRVGKQAIITFPNFAHWPNRLSILKGRMPVTKRLPYQWYDTPNIRVGTFADFRILAEKNGLRILDAFGLHEGEVVRHAPNLRASTAVFKFERG